MKAVDEKLLRQLKLSLRLETDDTEDDELLRIYLDTAKEYIKGAVGTNQLFYDQEDIIPLYHTAVIALASGYYLYRSSLVPMTIHPVNLSVNSIVAQLRGRYEALDERDELDGS